jgi:hypothetical protein
MRKQKVLGQDTWRGLIEEQAAGEQSIAAFCRDRGLKEHSFYRHKRRLRESNTAAGFREIELPRRCAIRIVVNQGVSHVEVEAGFDPTLLRDVVDALR